MDDGQKSPQSKLINIIRTVGFPPAKFALLLGAGASVTSNIKPAGKMIEQWRQQHYQQHLQDGESLQDYLARQCWFGKPEEYSVLFEALYDEPAQRRDYIETCVKNASPSWGYIYLVSLISNHVFNTVFTTNFDDLLNDACYKFGAKAKPIVCAHDSSIASIRITSSRPKIVKLHGDFLFDNIKNTVKELESMESNMTAKFRQFAGEYGLIVVGYSGHDCSVMDSLESFLEQENMFPHGIYWCVRHNTELSPRVEGLLQTSNFHVIEIGGFDEFFAELHAALGLDLPPLMTDPYGTLSADLNDLLLTTNIPDEGDLHPVIDRDMQSLGKAIETTKETAEQFDMDRHDAVKVPVGDTTIVLPIPFSLLARLKEREEKPDEAMSFVRRELTCRPKAMDFAYALSLIRKYDMDDGTYDELMSSLGKAERLFAEMPSTANDVAVQMISLGKFDDARDILERGENSLQQSDKTDEICTAYFTLNKLQILVHEGKEIDEENQLVLMELQESSDEFVKMGASILLKEYEPAEKWLSECLKAPPSRTRGISDWPIMKLLRPHMKEDALRRAIWPEE